MRQRTLGLLAAALMLVGATLSLGAGIAAQLTTPSTSFPASAALRVQSGRHHHMGPRFPGHPGGQGGPGFFQPPGGQLPGGGQISP